MLPLESRPSEGSNLPIGNGRLFETSPLAERVLRTGKIIGEEETPTDMVNRVVGALASVEPDFGSSPKETTEFQDALRETLLDKKAVFSTPILTNAGRFENRPLSACTVPPVDLRGDLAKVGTLVDAFHQDGMGTGFNLTVVDDPVRVLRYLNDRAVAGASSGKEDRPVGNMGILHVTHPRILEFIHAKDSVRDGVKWNFNISVDADSAFMDAVEQDTTYTLTDGTELRARDVFEEICENVTKTGEPGILFMERMNEHNPVPELGLYTGTAPCAEVGLAAGESCQFGYVNMAAFYKNGEIDLEGLGETTRLMVRALDDALEWSLPRYAHADNTSIMAQKRTIGIGVCGLADLLADMQLPYDSPEARAIIQDLVAVINFQSKIASHELAKTRGSFLAMDSEGNRHIHTPPLIEQRYGELDTRWVNGVDWRKLAQTIKQTRHLRHSTTIALPPTGRSGLVIDASTGVEPLFSLATGREIYPPLLNSLKEMGLYRQSIVDEIVRTGSIQQIDQIPASLKAVYKTALDISPLDHLRMVAAIQPVVDHSISKTVNLPTGSTARDVGDIYLQSHKYGLKGTTVYVNQSIDNQPKQL